MSEEKMYAVKNDEGQYWDFEFDKFKPLSESFFPSIAIEDNAKGIARNYGGHVVALVEEPKKVVLSKEQAEIVKNALDAEYPATYISDHSYADEERLIINAYVNGYTVAKEKKYNVKVPHTKEVWYCKYGDSDLLAICPADKKLRGEFTESEIEQYGLQDCEKEEVADNEQ